MASVAAASFSLRDFVKSFLLVELVKTTRPVETTPLVELVETNSEPTDALGHPE